MMGDGLAWARAEKARVERGKPSGMSFVADIVRRDGARLTELALAEWGPQERNKAVNRGARVTSIKGAAEDSDLGTLLNDAGFDDREERELLTIIKAGRTLSGLNKGAVWRSVEELLGVLQNSGDERAIRVLTNLLGEDEGACTFCGGAGYLNAADEGAASAPAVGKSRRLVDLEALAIELELMRLSAA